eukprot:comp46316_c0_seq1/m.47571 comp46316_c0_seq1/g.47571  ORF comp46316_c0_seq1/g.47571 comp46316_c0_seq1/m.47571 type:complete len:251 (-) comp46316_c0_seq1:584-1336(-)
MEPDKEVDAMAGQMLQTGLHERNCRETLVFGLDISPELCERRSPSNDTRLQYVSLCLSNYVHVRSRLHPQHRYGVVAMLGDTVAWAVEPTSSHDEFHAAMQVFVADIQGRARAKQLRDGDGVQLMSLISLLDRDCTPLPDELLRLVMVYTHSELFPDITSNADPAVMRKDNFFMDVLFLYDSTKESPQTIVDMLTQSIDNSLAQSSRGYTHTVRWDLLRDRLPECLAYLMGHPLQRPNEALSGRYELQQD